MNSETSTPTTSPPCTKRGRDPEDEVYIDNLHIHKRYLTEIMASSLNGLTVDDPLPDNLMESPSRCESVFYPRDDLCSQYSPMSEDSYDSPVLCCRTQRPVAVASSPAGPPPRQNGAGDSDRRFPSSPSDICQPADLRRAALLRSVQMKAGRNGDYGMENCSAMGSGCLVLEMGSKVKD